MCIYCRTTDELCYHPAPAVSADGQGYTIATPGEAPPLWQMRPDGTLEALDTAGRLAAAEARIEALEIMVLELRSRERLSREP
jgi:hypothetical protein